MIVLLLTQDCASIEYYEVDPESSKIMPVIYGSEKVPKECREADQIIKVHNREIQLYDETNRQIFIIGVDG